MDTRWYCAFCDLVECALCNSDRNVRVNVSWLLTGLLRLLELPVEIELTYMKILTEKSFISSFITDDHLSIWLLNVRNIT